MNESVAVAKVAETQKDSSPTKSDNSSHRAQNEPEMQLGSLRGVINTIRLDGGTPSVDSIATQLSNMTSTGRAPVLQALQQTHGNMYVQQVVLGVQAKLMVGQPNDRYEQEADRVADTVMRTSEPQVQRQPEEEEEKKEDEELVQTKTIAEQNTPVVQRQVEEEKEEEEEEEEEELMQSKPFAEQITPLVQRQPEGEVVQSKSEKSVSSSYPGRYVHRVAAWIQAKLKPGPPNDRYEQEADRVADMVMRAHEPQVQRQPEEEEDEELVQTKTIADQNTPLVQRPVGAPLQTKPRIQRQEGKEEAFQTKQLAQREAEEKHEVVHSKSEPGQHATSSSLSRQLTATQTGGFPLPPGIRAQMEPHFGADFSHVRVHTDQSAHQMNLVLHAQAFTHQHHIYFREGHYNPGTSEGRRLIAHELTHVVQQGAVPRMAGLVTNHSAQTNIQRSWLSNAWEAVTGAVGGAVDFVSQGLEAGKRSLMRHLSNLARDMPGYRLLCVVLDHDPITGDRVVKNGRNFIEAGLDVIPNGRQLRTKLEEEGALGEAAAWLDEQIELLDFSPSAIVAQFRRLWNRLSLDDLADPGGVLRRVQNIFLPPIGRLFQFARNVARRLLQIVKDYLISRLINFIRERTRAYPLVRVILGQDPITGEEVPRSGMNLIRGFMELSEAGAEKLRQMEETGTLQRAANWIDNAVGRITGNVHRIIAAFENLWGEVTIQNLMDPTGAFARIFRSFAEPIADIMNFLIEVGIQVLTFIKDALIQRMVAFARTVRGYPLLTVILGRDPFSGERVPRTAENFIRGFLSLLSDGEERFRNLQQSGAIDRALAWLNNEVERLNLTWEAIRTLFVTAWERLSIGDLANPPAAFQRMVDLFSAPVSRILSFAGAVGMKILEFVFEGVMGAGGARVLAILRRAGDTFMTIVNDPVGFLRNLIDAVVQGFRRFGQNIRRHLVSGLVGWLFGALQGAGLQLPERLDMRGIISLALQILGLTYQRIRPRLVRLLGERTVAFLERTFEVVRLLATEGPAAIWQRIVEYAGNLRDRVMEGIRNWVITRVVISGVTYVASLFNPAGAVIQAIRITYNVIMWFIERIQQLMALVEAITNSISNIASGNIGAAANYVEQSLGRILPLIISLLARLLGLGGISNTIRRIIGRIRRPVDRAIDRVVRWIVRQARRLGRFVARAGVPQDPNTRLRLAVRAAAAAARRLSGRITQPVLTPILAAIRIRYGLHTLVPYEQAGSWWVRAAINPVVNENLGIGTDTSSACNCTPSEPNYNSLSNPTRPTRVEACVIGNVTQRGSRFPRSPSWWTNLPSSVSWQRAHFLPRAGGGRGTQQNLLALTESANSSMTGADTILGRARNTPGACLRYVATASFRNESEGSSDHLFPERVGIEISPMTESTDNTTFRRTVSNYTSQTTSACNCTPDEPNYNSLSNPTRPTRVEACVIGNVTQRGSRFPRSPSWWTNLPSGVSWQRAHFLPRAGGGRGTQQNLLALTESANSSMTGADTILGRARNTPGACLRYVATASFRNESEGSSDHLFPERVGIEISPMTESTDNTTFRRTVSNR